MKDESHETQADTRRHTLQESAAPSRRVFLDHASATPLDVHVAAAMRTFEDTHFANPSALYKEGVEVRSQIDEARSAIATALHARPHEIVFTGSGTESVNLALRGIVRASALTRPHCIASAVEHPAVLTTMLDMEQRGEITLSIAPVDETGAVRVRELAGLIRDDTVLVSVMYAQNEVGTLQDIRSIGKVIRAARERFGSPYPYFHTDASQAFTTMPVSLRDAPDLITLDAAKIYGPKGIGLLVVRSGVRIDPIITGGAQERGMRAGTEDGVRIIGFAEAVRIAHALREQEGERLRALTATLAEGMLALMPDAIRNGDAARCLPGLVSICYPGVDAEYLVLKLDARGFAVSFASSCRTLGDGGSEALRALGNHPCDGSSLRVSLGRLTLPEDVHAFLIALSDALMNP
jgi:cysteine desulfurase